MNILHIAGWWPSRVHPNHGNFIQKHVRLVARCHVVTVLAVQEDPNVPYGRSEIRSRQGSNYTELVVYFGRPHGTIAPLNLWSRFRAIALAVREYRRTRPVPDLIHGHILIDGGIVAAILGKIWRVPYVITEHATIYHRIVRLSPFRHSLARWASAGAASMLPVSQDLVNAMQGVNLPGRYQTISNVVDVELFRLKETSARRICTQPLRLIHVSNFDDGHKNISGLLRTYRRLIFDFPGAYYLTLAGDGDIAALQELMESLGVDPATVGLTGPHTETEVAQLMRQQDAFVLFSNHENQPVVLLEAQCVGLPCIATRVGGIPDIIREGENTGYLIQPGDEDGLYRALVRLQVDYDQFSSEKIRSCAVSRYGERAVLAQLNEVYRHSITTG